jgi:hypothetical protein
MSQEKIKRLLSDLDMIELLQLPQELLFSPMNALTREGIFFYTLIMASLISDDEFLKPQSLKSFLKLWITIRGIENVAAQERVDHTL